MLPCCCRMANEGIESLTSSPFAVAATSTELLFISCIDVEVFFNNPIGMLTDTYLMGSTGTNIPLVRVLTTGWDGQSPNATDYPDYTNITESGQWVQYCVHTGAGCVNVPAGTYQWRLQQMCPPSLGGYCGGSGRDTGFARPYAGKWPSWHATVASSRTF